MLTPPPRGIPAAVDVWIGLAGYYAGTFPGGRRLAALPSGPPAFTARSAPGETTVTITDWGTLKPRDLFMFTYWSENLAGRDAERLDGATWGVPEP